MSIMVSQMSSCYGAPAGVSLTIAPSTGVSLGSILRDHVLSRNTESKRVGGGVYAGAEVVFARALFLFALIHGNWPAKGSQVVEGS